MTRRAGKRKHRMGSQRMPPSAKPTPREPTIVRDDLPPAESMSLELQSLAKGWLNESADFDKVRTALINKVAKAGLEATDPNLTIRAMRAVAQTEQRTKQLQLAAKALEIRSREGLPDQLPAAVAPDRPQEQTPYELIQELITRRDVRNALDYRPTDSTESSKLG